METDRDAKKPSLVIFDCDGVLVDSDRISLQIQAERISALGHPLPSGWVEELEVAVHDGFRRELRPVPGIVEALESIDVPTCVASSGSLQRCA